MDSNAFDRCSDGQANHQPTARHGRYCFHSRDQNGQLLMQKPLSTGYVRGFRAACKSLINLLRFSEDGPPRSPFHSKTKRNNMHRRDFLIKAGTVLAGATLGQGTVKGNPAPSGASTAGGRIVLPINRNWRYNRSVVAVAHEKNFDDSAFESVVLPHTDVPLPWHSFDDKTYEFVSMYRRRFKLPP